MSPGKSSPVIRTDLFLTGDQSRYGGKGEPSKTGVQSTLLLVPPNCAALVRGTGRFCLTKDNGRGSASYLCRPTALCLFAARGRGLTLPSSPKAMVGQATSQRLFAARKSLLVWRMEKVKDPDRSDSTQNFFRKVKKRARYLLLIRHCFIQAAG